MIRRDFRANLASASLADQMRDLEIEVFRAFDDLQLNSRQSVSTFALTADECTFEGVGSVLGLVAHSIDDQFVLSVRVARCCFVFDF